MGLFKNFSDVTVRTETIPEKSDLEKVFDCETEIINQYERNKQFNHFSGEEHVAYQSLYTTVQKKLANIKITQELLQDYIDARDNTEKNTQAKIRGIYSATLLEIISTKTPETHIVIDGKGRTFNYLFYDIYNVKNLTLINIQGDFTLGNAGAHNGSVTNITLRHITGDWTLCNAGRNNGSVTNITLQHITGNYTLENAGRYKGNATNITLQYVKGNNILAFLGWNGHATNITLQDIQGNYTLSNLGYDGEATNITLQYLMGDNTLWYVSSSLGCTTNILREKQLTTRQKSILSQIQLIVETIHALSLEKKITAHDKIARLQTEIFSEEKK